MATIISVSEDYRQTTTDVENDELDFTGSLTRVFYIDFEAGSDPIIMPVDAVDAFGDYPAVDGGTLWIPDRWETHPADPWMYVIKKTATYSTANQQKVTVYYSRLEEPLDKTPKISWSFATSNEPIDTDTYGDPIVNSAGESFDPPITMDVDDLVLRIEKNQSNYDELQAAEYKNAVNSDYFWGYAPGTCILKIYDGSQQRIAGLTYWVVNYEIQIRWDGWKRRIVNEGFRYKTGTQTDSIDDYKIAKDTDNNPLSSPILLNTDGTRLPTGSDPVFLEFELYKSLPFATLGLE